MNEIRIPLKFIGDCVMIVTEKEGIVKNTSESGKDEGDLARTYIECDDIYVEDWGETVREADAKPIARLNDNPQPANIFKGVKRMRVPLWFGEYADIAIPAGES